MGGGPSHPFPHRRFFRGQLNGSEIVRFGGDVAPLSSRRIDPFAAILRA